DEHISCRRWFLIDCDVVRPAGISSTNEEHAKGICRATEIRDLLRLQGWPDPILADSGNGGHLLYHLDLPNTAKETELLKTCLAALALRFDDEHVTIDPVTYNASRICKLYGTLAAKGDDMPGRPHRYAKLMDVPEEIMPVSRELIEQLAAMVIKPSISKA